ncbi:MAG: hypothetical protein M3072_00820 [Candidatus Dormibacteraeota bacterium]|nr:hypothetical protein [Candidatus Dormibacteraeota bacterium]
MIYLQLAGRVLLALARIAMVAAALGSSVRTVIPPRASVSIQHPGSVPGGAAVP